ncbi:MAG: hypothetical protein AAF658_07525, partial [Myxococcota bacterium]
MTSLKSAVGFTLLSLALTGCGTAIIDTTLDEPGPAENGNDNVSDSNSNMSSGNNSNGNENANDNINATPGVPAGLTFVEGVGQSAVVNSALTVPPGVRVDDGGGLAVPNVEVTFTVTAGAGSVSAMTATTDTQGIARTPWTLGTAVGINTLQAAVDSLTATLDATGLPGPVNALVAEPNVAGQVALASTAVPVAPAVRAEDAFDNPVPGVAVAFIPASGSGTVVGGNATTDANGVAAVTSWTLGAGTGVQTLNVAAGAVSLQILATAANVVPDDLELVAGNNQTGTAGGALPTDLQVRLVDADDDP